MISQGAMRALSTLTALIFLSALSVNATEVSLKASAQQSIEKAHLEIARLSQAVGIIQGDAATLITEGAFQKWNTEKIELSSTLRNRFWKYIAFLVPFFGFPFLTPHDAYPFLSFGLTAGWFAFYTPSYLKDIRTLEFDSTKVIYRDDMAQSLRSTIATLELHSISFILLARGCEKNESQLRKLLQAELDGVQKIESELNKGWDRDPRPSEELPKNLHLLVLEHTRLRLAQFALRILEGNSPRVEPSVFCVNLLSRLQPQNLHNK